MSKSDDRPIVPDRQAAPTASPRDVAISCLPVIVIAVSLLMLGRCVFGGGDEPQTAVIDTPAAVPSVPPTTTTGDTAQVGSNMLEQAIFDAFPAKPATGKKARQKTANAADYLGATINAAGYLCAKPIEAQRVSTGQYGIGCRTDRAAGGQANYIVDIRTGSVTEI